MLDQQNFQILISCQWRIVCRIFDTPYGWILKIQKFKKTWIPISDFNVLVCQYNSRLSGPQWHLFIHPPSCLDPSWPGPTKGEFFVTGKCRGAVKPKVYQRTSIAEAGLGISSTVCVWISNIYFWVLLTLVLKPYAIYLFKICVKFTFFSMFKFQHICTIPYVFCGASLFRVASKHVLPRMTPGTLSIFRIRRTGVDTFNAVSWGRKGKSHDFKSWKLADVIL